MDGTTTQHDDADETRTMREPEDIPGSDQEQGSPSLTTTLSSLEDAGQMDRALFPGDYPQPVSKDRLG